MSTSFLYHVFGLVGYNYVKTQYQGNAIIFTIFTKRKLQCPACKSRKVILRGQSWRFKAFRFGFKIIYLELEVQRVGCLTVTASVKFPLALPIRGFLTPMRFERYALELSKHMTIQDVAKHLSVSWDVIKDIQKRYLTKRFSKPCLKHLKTIAIDEIAVRKGISI